VGENSRPAGPDWNLELPDATQVSCTLHRNYKRAISFRREPGRAITGCGTGDLPIKIHYFKNCRTVINDSCWLNIM